MANQKFVSATLAVSDKVAISSLVSGALSAGDVGSAKISLRGSAAAIVSVLLGLGEKASDVSALLTVRRS